MITQNFNEAEKDSSVIVFHDTETELIIDEEVEETAGISSLLLQCDQCDYKNATEKGLSQHKRMRHWISQIYGLDDCTEDEVTAQVIKEEPASFEMGTDGYKI